MTYRKLARLCWRRFYRNHREGLEELGDLLGAVSVFLMIFSYFILGAIIGG